MPAVPFARMRLAFLPAPHAAEKGRRKMRRARPNKPKRLKTLVISKIAHETEKLTQAYYHPWYQSLTAIFGRILRKFVWIAPAPLRIRRHGLRVGRRPSLGGLTTKARMSFRMNRMAFDTACYHGLGCYQSGRVPQGRLNLDKARRAEPRECNGQRTGRGRPEVRPRACDT